MRGTRRLLFSWCALAVACGGTGGGPDAGPSGPQTVPIAAADAASASASLNSIAATVAGKSSLHALAARGAAVALQAGTKGTPVTLTSGLVGGTGTESARARLSIGTTLVFGIQVVLVNAPAPIPSLSGVVILKGTTGGIDSVLAIGPAPSSAVPPTPPNPAMVGILVRNGGEVWTATQGQVTAQLAGTTVACAGPAIPGVTCLEATFSTASLAITAFDPYAGGATGQQAAGFGPPPGGIAGVSLTVDCGLTTLCPPPAAPAAPSYFFAADDGVHGVELWGTDGTPAGTAMIKDIHPSAGSKPRGFTALGGFTYFSANDGTNGVELWRTDGTAAGTTLVTDIQPGAGSSSPSGFTVVGSELFFSAVTGDSGSELWKTDGTTTSMVADIQPGQQGSSPASLHEFGGALYFQAYTVAAGRELWTSDGTAANTVLVKDINPGSTDGLVRVFTEFNGELYFEGLDVPTGAELWKTNGAPGNATELKDIAMGPASSVVFNLTVVGSTLFFTAVDSGGNQLWATDGTSGNTRLVKPGLAPSSLAELNGKLYFSCLVANATNASNLCASDGTAGGTGPVTVGTDPRLPAGLTSALGVIFFQAFESGTGGGGTELWRSDGTSAGTFRLKDINPGTASSFPADFTPVSFPNLGDRVVFRASTEGTGSELWITDGTAAGTQLLKDILPGPASGVTGL